MFSIWIRHNIIGLLKKYTRISQMKWNMMHIKGKTCSLHKPKSLIEKEGYMRTEFHWIRKKIQQLIKKLSNREHGSTFSISKADLLPPKIANKVGNLEVWGSRGTKTMEDEMGVGGLEGIETSYFEKSISLNLDSTSSGKTFSHDGRSATSSSSGLLSYMSWSSSVAWWISLSYSALVA